MEMTGRHLMRANDAWESWSVAHQGLSAIFAHVQIIKCEYARFYPCIFAFFHLCLSVLFCFVLLCSSLRLCSPHLCVRFLFLVLYPVRLLSSSFRPCFVTPTFTQLFHTRTHFCHTQLCHTHTHLCHTTLSHSIFHTQLCHTHLCHTRTTLSHTIFHTQLCHTRFCHTHSFDTHTQLCHTQLFHTHAHIFVTRTTWSHTSLSHATLSHTIFAWLAWWPLATSTLHLRGRRSTWRHPPTPMLCVAGLALGGTSTALCVARVCHLWHGGALSRGCVAGVALGDIDVAFAWEACRLAGSTYVCVAGMGLWHWAASGGALRSRGRRGTLRGRRRTWRHPPALFVAGLALGDIHLCFAWQAWRLWHWAGSGGALGARRSSGRCGTLRGKRRAWRHPPALCVAGLALGDIRLRFVWQAWRIWHSAQHFARQAWHLATSTLVWRGRRGTWRHPLALCVASVALGDIHLCFAWQAWRLWHWAGSGGALGARRSSGRCGTLRGKHRAWRHPPALCVAGLALGDIRLRFVWQAWRIWHSAQHFARQAWHLATSTLVWRGRRGTWRHPLALCVASVALGDIHLCFAWQAWRLWLSRPAELQKGCSSLNEKFEKLCFKNALFLKCETMYFQNVKAMWKKCIFKKQFWSFVPCPSAFDLMVLLLIVIAML